MKKTKLLISRKPGKITIDNFEDMLRYVDTYVRSLNVGEYQNNIGQAKHDRKLLLKLKSELEADFKEPSSVYLKPYDEARGLLVKLFAKIDIRLAVIDKCIACEKRKPLSKTALRAFYDENSHILGDYADAVFESPAFVDEKWILQTSVSAGTKNEMLAKIEKTAKDISSIETTSHSLAPVLTARYLETLSMDDVHAFKELIVKAANGSLPGVVRTLGDECARTDIELNCSKETLFRTLDQLRLMGVDYRIKSSTFPMYLKKLEIPDFDSFVALDIETTGSLGAAFGDGPAEITEIGAVKVENGIITDRFSMLANPGRPITRHVAKLTHITDDMVADKPTVDVVVREFLEFAKDSILVGHGIGGNDLSFICKAAGKYGIEMKNDYFDTCDLASDLKAKYGWQKIKLEYLSSIFGIKQSAAHRAWCDAEANVGVYFALKTLWEGNQ